MRGFAHDSQVLKLVSVVMMALIGSTNASCGHENGRACCAHERLYCNSWKKVWGENVCTGWGTRGACSHGLTETSGCRGSCGGCSSSMCRRITSCGYTNQRACCATERVPSCIGDLIEKLDGCHGNNCYCARAGGFLKSAGHCRARDCGHENQRACCVHERPGRPCDSGLTETPGCSNCGCSISTCRRITSCGGTNERGCCVNENNADPCKGDLIPKPGCSGNCWCTDGLVPSASTCKVRDCGRDGQRACCVTERIGQPCDSGLTETTGCTGSCGCSITKCHIITACGGENQRACCVNENGGMPCKGDLIQKDGCNGNCWCTGGLVPSAGTCKKRDCGRRDERACCVLERPSAPCDSGLIIVPGCSGCGCSISKCMAPEDIAGNVVGFVGEVEAASQVVSNLITSIPTEISNLKNWITMEFNSKVKTRLDQAVQIAERLSDEINNVPNKLETKGNEIKNTIQTTFDRLKPRVLSVTEIVADETLKAISKIQLFFDEATTIDTDLLGCVESFTPEVAKFFIKALTIGGDEIVKKVLTEILKPHACVLCSSKFSTEALRRFNCPDGQRRLSDDLWYAIDLYGPDKKRIDEDVAQTIEQNNEFKNNMSSERELKSSPVTNNLGTCPHAPEVSANPAYSDTSHHAYSVAMQPLQLLSITNPSDDKKMWDTRTDQNLVAAVLLAELILNTIFEFHEKICEAIPETICYGFCATNTAQALCWSMTGIGAAFRAFFASILAAVDLHDGVIDGAEIEATLINTEKLVNWTCAIEKHISVEFEAMKPAQISYTEVKDQSLQLIDRSDPNPAEVREWVLDISNKVDSLQTSVIAEIEALTNEFRQYKSIIHRRLLANQ